MPKPPPLTPYEQLVHNIYEVTMKAHILKALAGINRAHILVDSDSCQVCAVFEKAIEEAMQHAADIIRHRKDE